MLHGKDGITPLRLAEADTTQCNVQGELNAQAFYLDIQPGGLSQVFACLLRSPVLHAGDVEQDCEEEEKENRTKQQPAYTTQKASHQATLLPRLPDTLCSGNLTRVCSLLGLQLLCLYMLRFLFHAVRVLPSPRTTSTDVPLVLHR